jgi:hypothetical protein
VDTIRGTLAGPHVFQQSLTAAIFHDLLHSILTRLLEDAPLQTTGRMWFMIDGAPPYYRIAARTLLNDNIQVEAAQSHDTQSHLDKPAGVLFMQVY